MDDHVFAVNGNTICAELIDIHPGIHVVCLDRHLGLTGLVERNGFDQATLDVVNGYLTLYAAFRKVVADQR